jgi:hypothetical protein
MRSAGGDVSRADVLEDDSGLVEYRNADDMERAIRKVPTGRTGGMDKGRKGSNEGN